MPDGSGNMRMGTCMTHQNWIPCCRSPTRTVCIYWPTNVSANMIAPHLTGTSTRTWCTLHGKTAARLSEYGSALTSPMQPSPDLTRFSATSARRDRRLGSTTTHYADSTGVSVTRDGWLSERLELVRAAQQLLEPPAFASLQSLIGVSEDRTEVDLGRLADHWLVLIHPTLQAHLKRGGGSRLLRLRDIRATLKREPLSTEQLLTLVNEARWVRPVDERVVSAIVGVVDQ